MTPAIPWTPEAREQLLGLMRSGPLSNKELARKMGRTPGSVAGEIGRMRAAGVHLPHRHRKFGDKIYVPSDPVIRKIMEAAQRKGFCRDSLARRVGCSKSTVDAIVRGNVQFRTVAYFAEAVGVRLEVVDA